MSTDITPFNFDGQPVRVVTIDNEPWFVLNDLCLVLDINNSRMVAARLDEGCVSQTDVTDSLGRARQTTIVNEPGMYEVVIRSDKPEATTFRRWITSDVLPQIRKTGSYGTAPALTGPQLMAAALIEAQTTMTAQTERIAVLEPKADYVDTFVASEDLRILRHVANSINIPEGELRALLLETKWIYAQESTRWSDKRGEIVKTYRYSAHADKRDYFRHIPSHDAPRFRGEVMHTLKVTPQGALAVQRLVERNGLHIAS